MIARFKELFSNGKNADTKPGAHELQLAAATLMFELVKSDGSIDDIERQQMTRLLQEQFKLDQPDLDLLNQQAEESSDKAISLQGFTRAICDSWEHDDRVQMLEHLWVLAMADNRVDTNERHLIRKIAGLLYINDKDIIIAQERAKTRLFRSESNPE